MTFPQRPFKLLATSAAAILMVGCASLNPEALSEQEIQAKSQSDLQKRMAEVAPISGAITLEEAIARALKYNLDHRAKSLEMALASGQLEAGKYDMLPRLLANAGYFSRDSDLVRRSQDVNGNTYDNKYISSERNHATQDLTLSWSMLDFGASYYSAKQNGDRLLIATERRRKSMHTLIQNVRTTYWRALAAQTLSQRVSVAITEAEAALKDSRGMQAAKVRLRPILMTSIAFCAGVIPLILGSGAGSEMRRAMGIAVFSGMLGVTFFGLFLTPVFYVLLRTLAVRLEKKPAALPAAAEKLEGSH